MLARIDGKSKIPYITDEPTKELARGVAREILTSGETSLRKAFDKLHTDPGPTMKIMLTV
jgi:hypothetical protein